VCRTFGDIEAKIPQLLGNPKVVIAEPDVSWFKIDPNSHDFIVLGCDGIFDKLEDRDVVHTVWQSVIPQAKLSTSGAQQSADQPSYDHSLSGIAVDSVLKTSAVRRSADNITVVFIAFDNFFNLVKESKGDITRFEPNQIQLNMIEL